MWIRLTKENRRSDSERSVTDAGWTRIPEEKRIDAGVVEIWFADQARIGQKNMNGFWGDTGRFPGRDRDGVAALCHPVLRRAAARGRETRSERVGNHYSAITRDKGA